MPRTRRSCSRQYSQSDGSSLHHLCPGTRSCGRLSCTGWCRRGRASQWRPRPTQNKQRGYGIVRAINSSETCAHRQVPSPARGQRILLRYWASWCRDVLPCLSIGHNEVGFYGLGRRPVDAQQAPTVAQIDKQQANGRPRHRDGKLGVEVDVGHTCVRPCSHDLIILAYLQEAQVHN